MVEHNAASECCDADFDALAVRYLDGSAAIEEVELLKSQLDSEPVLRERFATLCVVMTGLDEVFTLPPLHDNGEREPEIQIPQVESSLPVLGFLGNAWQGTVGFFSQEIPFSLLIASVVTGLGLLFGSMVYVTHHTQLADGGSTSATLAAVPLDRKMAALDSKYVGRVTGIANCRWEEGPGVRGQGSGNTNRWTSLNPKTLIALGDKFILASGLLEITYDTGATVILQGPVAYEVDSRDGGFLSIGKLTAKLEKKRSGVRGQWAGEVASGQPLVVSGQWPVASRESSGGRVQDTEAVNQKSEIRNQKSFAPVFAVRTPTATVTDLGTEFGVEVDQKGRTFSHVFRGSVEMRLTGGYATTSKDNILTLHENEAAQTMALDPVDHKELALRPAKASPTSFVRMLPVLPSKPKMLDLLTVVAGGYGDYPRRERGIDPTTGGEITMFFRGAHPDDGQYHPVLWHKFIDGVFVPHVSDKPVVIDSQGHTFSGFLPTNGVECCPIWARAASGIPADPATDRESWVYSLVGPVDKYMPEKRGLLCLHPNAGITFNLDAIREANRRFYPGRLRAVAAVDSGDPRGKTDIWILVDGKVKFERTRLVAKDNPVLPVDVSLDPNAHFLTLVTTDGGDIPQGDWVVFGDPVLEMAPNAIEQQEVTQP